MHVAHLLIRMMSCELKYTQIENTPVGIHSNLSEGPTVCKLITVKKREETRYHGKIGSRDVHAAAMEKGEKRHVGQTNVKTC